MMKKYIRIVEIIFAVPWVIFGIQHFLYADFVAGLVPAYFPARYFFALFTGTAMIAAGISFIFNKWSAPAAVLLGVMLLIFIILIHVPTIAGDLSVAIKWTRGLQDLAIASSAFMLAKILLKPQTENKVLEKTAGISRYIFAFLLIVFGVEYFLNLDFLTAKIPDYLPLQMLWRYLAGIILIITGISVFVNKKAVLSAIISGVFLLIFNLLFHVYTLANDLHNPLNWTAAMLDLVITCGVFILAISSSDVLKKDQAL